MLSPDEVSDWSSLQEDHLPDYTSWVIFGNGPSRDRGALHIDPFVQMQSVVCWANPGYVDAPFGFGVDVTVCWDRPQIDLAMECSSAPVVYPDHRTPRRLDPARCYVVREYHSTPRPGLPYEGPEKPSGNTSGHLAYQLALLCGAKHITMVGIDCCVEDDGTYTAVRSGRAGYQNTKIELSRCVDVAGVKVPKSWLQHREEWLKMTKWAADRGVETKRAIEYGSLDWLPIS